ncbi:hypothetical protein WA026_019502 [Henosepilachna vigintioctopunctata]|uniref:Uncharacterized protein n=1 Tax=Henosepilachna vigintioctopunctata TaxID=420089 RepID=A0AAW1TX51_9CUCU
MTYDNITSGFKATGLYPLNVDAIPETAFAPSMLTERRISESNSNDCVVPSEVINTNVRSQVNSTGSDTNIETYTDSRQSSPILNLYLHKLIDAEKSLPLSPVAPDLRIFSSFSPIECSTPTRIIINNQDCVENLSGPSGSQITRRLVEYSDNTEDEQCNTECDIENVNPNNDTFTKSDGEDTEDDQPLAKIARNMKTDFQQFMPTPEYGVVKSSPRKKALNYRGQRVTKDLFNTDKEQNKKKSRNTKKERKLPKKPTNKRRNGRLNQNQLKIKNSGTVLLVKRRGLQI